MKKVGVFGGTFNPIHNGHVQLASNYVEALRLDKLLVVPTRQPPHKIASDLVSPQMRLKMCQLAFAQTKRIFVDDLEIQRKGKSYTVDTIRQLLQRETDSEFYLLVGSDMFLTFSQWKDWQDILSLLTLCTASRNADEVERLQQMGSELASCGKTPLIFDFPVLTMSSTEIRERLLAGQDCGRFLDPQVYAFILKHHLYTQKEGRDFHCE